ncbi:MDR family MFS transporter [Aspergillus mulundensis]|uniref:Major facilitator superfamily n=1 Tax=Aspergillus mulundensis TaxID=1810919 RepID=A0A3D8QJ80_9EURO|nr:Major facilitator superfamily [Aspergillus mulundensis]RDW61771.1 Major facilitator superfamily [Aspergillus mulundensis]
MSSPTSTSTSPSTPGDSDQGQPPIDPSLTKKGARFWLIMLALTVSGLLAALESTVVATALPSITAELGDGAKYTWVIIAYFLTMTAFQPLFGQLSDIYGRRYLVIISVAVFALGSGICGGASSMDMLIAGRAVQGLGAGGINVLVETIVCDIVPLRERGSYLGIVFGGITVGTAIGPVIAGVIVQRSTWRWVFYLNLPIAGVGLVLLVLFLRVKTTRATLAQLGRRLDWIGNALFVAASTSVLIGIGWAGAVHPWGSAQVVVPLVLGMLGLVATLVFEGVFEGTRYCADPFMPLHLFSNRTSAVAFIATFFHGITTVWVLYFLPVYFQGVLMSSPIRSGVQLLPTALFMTVAAVVGGATMQKLGKYKIIHIVGFGLITIGFGIFSLLDGESSTAEWVIFQLIASGGLGLIISTALPAVQAKLTDADTAKATGTWQFLRSFGLVFGSAIPTAIFNTRFDEVADRVGDEQVRALLVGGHAYEHATQAFLRTLDETTRAQVIDAFTVALKRSWQVGIAFAGVGVLLALLEEQVELREELKGDFGIQEGRVKEEKANVQA